MDEALRPEKIQSAVNGDGGGRLLAGGRNPLNQIIGADRTVRGVERFQDRTAQGCEPFAPRHAQLFSRGQSSGCARGVVMRMGAIMGGVFSHSAF